MTTTQAERIEKNSDELSAEEFFAARNKELEEKTEELMENHLLCLENEKNCTMLYDPVTKKKRDYAECKYSYGKKMADKMYKAKKEGFRLDPADYAKLMQQQKGTRLSGKPEKKKPKGRTGSFIRLDHEFVRSPRARKALRKSMMLYVYIRSYIVRKNYAGDKLNLYRTYFKKGQLASSVSIRKLAAELGFNAKTVATYLKKMAEDGIIKIEKVSARDAYDNQQHNVYVFGTHDSNHNEFYFVEELLTTDQ